MLLYTTGIILLILLIGFMIGSFIRDRCYEKKKTSETFGPALKEEIENEREEGLERRRKFHMAIERAKDAEDPDRTLR